MHVVTAEGGMDKYVEWWYPRILDTMELMFFGGGIFCDSWGLLFCPRSKWAQGPDWPRAQCMMCGIPMVPAKCAFPKRLFVVVVVARPRKAKTSTTSNQTSRRISDIQADFSYPIFIRFSIYQTMLDVKFWWPHFPFCGRLLGFGACMCQNVIMYYVFWALRKSRRQAISKLRILGPCWAQVGSYCDHCSCSSMVLWPYSFGLVRSWPERFQFW